MQKSLFLIRLVALILLIPLGWIPSSAQSYYMQYTHDSMGNRTERIRQTMRGSMDFSVEYADTALLRNWWPQQNQNDDSSGFIPWQPDGEKSRLFRKSREEKIAYEEAQLAEILALEPIPSRRTRNRDTYDVGAIPLEYSLSPGGARTYNVPIYTAPDIKYAPSLSLVYNSQGGHGYGGYGWDIGGISEIRLASKSPYYDGQIVAASALDTAAVFSLDGIRLVQNDDTATSGSYPLVTARGHILVSPHRNSHGFIDTFTALYPNGVVATYGISGNVAFQMPSYPITSSTNLDGERIEYDYTADFQDGNHTLTAIRYGFNSGGAADAVIQFSSTTQTASSYYAGKKVKRSPLLTQIVSKSGNSNLYTYSLQYETVFGANLLSSISLTNASGRQLPPLCFTYGNTANPHSGQDSLKMVRRFSLNGPYGSSSFVLRRGKFVKGNFNDGLVAYYDYPIYSVSGNNTYSCSYPVNSTVFYIASISDEGLEASYTITDSGFQTMEAVDVDGDGVDELVEVYCNATGSNGSNFLIKVRRCDDDGFFVLSYSLNVWMPGAIGSPGPFSPYYRAYRWGDFLGNGKAQLLVVNYSDNGYGCNQGPYTTLIDLTTGTKLYYSIPFTVSSTEDNRLFAMDIDGDSKTELCLATGTGLKRYRFINNSFVTDHTYSEVSLSFITSDNVFFTDINADGYIDIVKPTPPGGIWTFLLNTGLTFESKSIAITNPYSSHFFFFDINRDGLPDLLKINGQNMGYYLNIDGVSFNTYKSAYSSVIDYRFILPANVMDYTSMSSFIILDGFLVKEYGFTSYAPEQRYLVQSEDSFGKTIINSYRYLPNAALYWTENPTGIDASAGYQLKTLPTYVINGAVGKESNNDNAQTFLQDSYSWSDCVVNNRGLGFCGFSKIRTGSYLAGVYSIDVQRFNPQKAGVLIGTYAYLWSELNSPYSSSTYLYDEHSTTYGKFSPRMISCVANDNLNGIVKNTSIQYDDFDYPVTVTEQFSIGSGAPLTHIQSTSYSHNNTAQSYVLGTVLSQTVSTERDGNASTKWVERTSLTYDQHYHPLTRTQSVSPDSVSFTIVSKGQWTYDSHGNVLSERSAPYNSTEYVGDSYTYDASGRHMTSLTDALGLTTTYSGFTRYGNPTVVTDHMGRTCYLSYDTWGNKTKTVRPDNSVDSTATAWGGSGAYKVTHTATGQPPEIRDYDALGREVKRSQQRYNGQWQNTMTFYDAKGRVAYVSLPYRGATWTYRNRYNYDYYGRPTSIVEASGRQTTWSYSGTSVTETKDGISTTRTYNAMGDLFQCTDAAGTITYSLRDDGQPSSITAPGGAVTTFSFDAMGRRTSIIDPSAGTRTTSYTWNTNGTSSTTQTNDKGSITTSQDKYGRVTGITRSNSFNTTYSYDSYGRLISEVSTNSTGKEYTYDAYDRPDTLLHYVPDGKWLRKVFTYGAGSKVSSIIFASQDGYITTENYSYGNGYNTAVTLPGGTAILSLVSENDFGQPTSASSAGIYRTYEYSQYGFPTARKLSGGTLQNLTTTFNPSTGNLMSRGRHVTGQPSEDESFTYDDLGRLASTDWGAVTYTTNGNVISKGGVGTMTYTTTGSPYKIDKLYASSASVTRPAQQTVTYTSFDRPESISENGVTTSFIYDAGYNRVKMSTTDGVSTANKYYIGDRYEIEEPSSGSVIQRLFLGGDAYNAPMVLQKTGNGAWTPYVIGRDYLGSITNIVSTSGTLVAEYSYDAWGRMRDPQTFSLYAITSEPTLLLGRGYCGHEHLPQFGLINMNARLYDPVLGRFLSPDPYVQAPDFSQNFNRYAYALNNPLKYSDESGEYFVVDSWLIGFIGGGLSRANQMAKNDLRIWGGLFVTDKNKGSWGQAWEILSRFTVQAGQTWMGFLTAQTINTLHLVGGVESIDYLHGATVVTTKKGNWGAFTLGNYITGGNELKAFNGNELFQHEFGHYLQSQALGPFYFSKVAIPSVTTISNHDYIPVEQDANKRAFNYFKKYYPEQFDTYDETTGEYNGQWVYSIKKSTYGYINPIIDVDWLNYGTQKQYNESILSNYPIELNWSYMFSIFYSIMIKTITDGVLY
ncbi:MAG: hypothetical protein K6A64_07070 [Bacteroidales bacterium]|nr:hypothetical protein [Bacteroidales bacterium]